MADQTTPLESGSNPPVTPPAEKLLSQAEVDRIVKDRLEREKAKYADYDQLKTAAERLKAFEDSQKTDAQKTADRLAEIEKALGLKDQTIEKLQGELTGTKREGLAISVASRLGAHDPKDANVLAAISGIDPAGANAEAEIEAALKGLAEKKPYLFRQQGNPRAGVEAFNPPGQGGAPAETDTQRVKRVLSMSRGAGYGPLG